MKRAFAVGFALAAVSFFVFLAAYRETMLYVVSIHAALFFLAAYFIYEKDAFTTLRKLGIPGDLRRNTAYFIGAGAAVAIAMILLNLFLYWAGIRDGASIADTVRELPPYLLLFGIFLAPFSEELFFRAFLVERVGILPASLLFAVSHLAYGSVAELLGAFVIGLILAGTYKKSRSLVPGIGIHVLFNLLSIALIQMGYGQA